MENRFFRSGEDPGLTLSSDARSERSGDDDSYSTAIRINSGSLRAPSFALSCEQVFTTVL
jgi:hypothetical protein